MMNTGLPKAWTLMLHAQSRHPDSVKHHQRYVSEYSHWPPPHGTVTTTAERAKAMQFESPVLALEFWQQINIFRPRREWLDRKANRPLTAWHGEVQAVDEGEENASERLSPVVDGRGRGAGNGQDGP